MRRRWHPPTPREPACSGRSTFSSRPETGPPWFRTSPTSPEWTQSLEDLHRIRRRYTRSGVDAGDYPCAGQPAHRVMLVNIDEDRTFCLPFRAPNAAGWVDDTFSSLTPVRLGGGDRAAGRGRRYPRLGRDRARRRPAQRGVRPARRPVLEPGAVPAPGEEAASRRHDLQRLHRHRLALLPVPVVDL